VQQFKFACLTYIVSYLLYMYYYLQILLTNHLNPMFATGALVIPASFYFVLKVNSYYLYVDNLLVEPFKYCQCYLVVYFVKNYKYFLFMLLLVFSVREIFFHLFSSLQ